MSVGDFPESSSQAILVGIILVGRLGVAALTVSRAQLWLTASPEAETTSTPSIIILIGIIIIVIISSTQ